MNTEKPEQNTASIDWDREGQPNSKLFGDVYFSKDNGLKESEHVFLKGNALGERFSELAEHSVFRIAETGFGTGLNFLATWQLWQNSVKHPATLEFISVEKYPLQTEELAKALALWPELTSMSQQLLAAYPPQPWQGVQRMNFDGGHGTRIQLTIYFCDLAEALSEFTPCPTEATNTNYSSASFGEVRPHIDAWFLDGFAPSKNPEMWVPTLYECMALNSVKSVHSDLASTFATFTAAGDVRRGLQAQGFVCKKVAGFGRKREMLTGYFSQQTVSDGTQTASSSDSATSPSHVRFATWVLQNNSAKSRPVQKPVASAIIVGAGLAGAHLAFALSQRGLKVTVIEKGSVASGASSNFQGAVYTRLSASTDPLSVFNRLSQHYADSFYKQHGFYMHCGEQCGVIHLCSSDKDHARLKRFASQFNDKSRFEFLGREKASDLANLELRHDALLVKDSGWLHPPALCARLLSQTGISVIENTPVHNIAYTRGQWFAETDNGDISADICIVCNAKDALAFDQSAHLPLKTIRGQVSHCRSTGALQKLRTVICGEGYLCPQANWHGYALHSLGATFNLNDDSDLLRESDHRRNLQALDQISLEASLAQTCEIEPAFPGKVGFRSTSPDYFPMVGPLPVVNELMQDFAYLRKKANAIVDQPAKHYPGLYCSLAYGSRGLAYAPLCSALIADLITGAYLPISRSLYTYLHPARFAIRSLMKNTPYL